MNRLTRPVLVALLIGAITPVADWVFNILPLQLGDVNWRYGAFGLFPSFFLSAIIVFAVMSWIAEEAERPGVVRVLAVVELLVAIACPILMLTFALDAVQVRRLIKADDALKQFDMGAVKAQLKYLSILVSFAWLGISGLRSAGKTKAGGRDTKANPADLMVGRSR